MRGVVFAILVALIVGAAAAAPERPVTAAGVGAVVPGAALADIPLGTPFSEVLTRFGSPADARFTSSEGTLAYGFRTYGITVYVRANAVVAVSTTNSVVGLIGPIGLGSSTGDVVAAFGSGYVTGPVEGFPGLLYASQGIAFGFDHQALAVIMVFPATGSPASPGPRSPAPATPGASPAVTSSIAKPAAAPPVEHDPAGSAAQPVPSGAQEGSGIAAAPAPPTAEAPPSRSRGPAVPNPGPGSPAPAGAPRGPAGSALAPAVPIAPAAAAPVPVAAPQVPIIVSQRPPASSPDAVPQIPATRVTPSLRPFAAESRYLSLAGYLRYLVYGMTRVWIAPQEGERYFRQETAPAIP